MKLENLWSVATVLFCVCLLPCLGWAQSSNTGQSPIIVNSKFGGQIFGFDIDPNGTEGILSEAHTLPNGDVQAAVETFDQRTGQIIKVVAQKQSQDDFVTMGIVGNHIGLIEYEHEVSFLHIKRYFPMVNPLGGNRFTGLWTPPFGRDHIVEEVSRSHGSPNVAVFAYDATGNFQPYVFSSNVAANTFGPLITVTDEDFTSGSFPPIALVEKTNTAVLGHSTLGNPFIPPQIALVDLATGTFSKFTGVGTGDVNGLAVDPETGMACTTTEIDFSVQFYDLARRTGFSLFLPGANNQLFSGADVEFDPIHKVFLVAQPVSSTALSGSSIHVYDEGGNYLESINGLNFSNRSNVVPVHIALHPSRRAGYVDGPDPGVTQIQSFTY